jgi:hypothetical protein
MIGGQGLLGDQGMSLAVAQITRGRTDELGDFMGVLKFGAVNLNDRARAAKQNFCASLDDTRFAGTGRPQEQ